MLGFCGESKDTSVIAWPERMQGRGGGNVQCLGWSGAALYSDAKYCSKPSTFTSFRGVDFAPPPVIPDWLIRMPTACSLAEEREGGSRS